MCSSLVKIVYTIFTKLLQMNYFFYSNTLHKTSSWSIQYKWFTLVELIVTITILAILGTIGFISLQWWNISSRDSARLGNLAMIEHVVGVTQAKGGSFPRPDPSVIEILGSNSIIGYQGYYGTWMAGILGTSVFLDPLDKEFFTVSVNSSQTRLTAVAFLENTPNNIAIDTVLGFETVYASDFTARTPIGRGNGPIILLSDSGSTKNEPIQKQYSESSFTGVDIISTATAYIAVIPWKATISGSGNILGYLAFGGGKSCADLLNMDSGKKWKDGWYWINPDGSGTIQVYCDMTTNNGGWTLINNTQLWIESGRSYSSSITAGTNSWAIININPTRQGCGVDEPSAKHTVLIGPKISWSKIRYTQDFYGPASCWGIFGAVYSSDGSAANPNLSPFNIQTNSFLSSIEMNAYSASNPSINTRCDNSTNNFWHSINWIWLRSATTILTKTQIDAAAWLHTDASCLQVWVTKWAYHDIFVQ